MKTKKKKFTPVNLLRILMKDGFYAPGTGGIEWSYIEGTSIADIMGVEVEQALAEYMEEPK